jgi:hypothetical protein
VVPVQFVEEAPAMVSALRPCHGRAECACLPTKVTSACRLPETPQLDLSVGGLQHDGQVRLPQPGDLVEHVEQLVGLHRPLFAGVQHEHQVVGRGLADGRILERLHREHVAGLHVGGSTRHDDLPAVAGVQAGLDVVLGRGNDIEVADQQHQRSIAAMQTRGRSRLADDDAVPDADDLLAERGVAGDHRVGDRALLTGGAHVPAVLEQAIDQVGPQWIRRCSG